MKKKKLIVGIVIAVVAIIAVVLVITNPFSPSVANNTTNGTNTTEPNGNGGNPNPDPDPNRPPNTSNWISPGKFYIEDFECGQTVELLLEVHNGNPTSTTFSVDFRFPDDTVEGYVKGFGSSDWVRVIKKFPVLEAYETYIAEIHLYLPCDAEPPGEKWEFWIGVIDQSQEGMVVTELASRVLVTMK